MAARRSRFVAYSLFATLNLGAALVILGVHSAMQLRPVFSLFAPWAVGMAALATALGWLLQIGDIDPLSFSPGKAMYAGLKVGGTTLILVSAATALATQAMPRQVTLSFFAVSPLIAVLSVGPAVLLARTAEPERILVVGSYDDVHQLQTDLDEFTHVHARIVGHISGSSDEPRLSEIDSFIELGRERFIDSARELKPDVIVVDSRYLEDYELLSQVTALHAEGIRVRTFTDFYEQRFGKVPLSAVNEAWFLFDSGELHRTTYLRLKQAIDYVGAITGTVVFLLLLPVIALAIKLDSRGPVFYFQERVGRGGDVFRLLKFRTMREDAEENGPQWATESDGRITRVGSFLRRSRLDELPQFINVIKGDMSLVGPRAERPEFVKELETKIPFYSRRHLIKPGLTGWAQIRYRYGSTVEHALEKFQFELYYMKYQSAFLDMAIILNTLRVMLSMQGI